MQKTSFLLPALIFPYSTVQCVVPDLLHLGRDDGQVGLQVAVQQVRHHHPVRNYVYDEVPDTGEKFNLWQQQYFNFKIT